MLVNGPLGSLALRPGSHRATCACGRAALGTGRFPQPGRVVSLVW